MKKLFFIFLTILTSCQNPSTERFYAVLTSDQNKDTFNFYLDTNDEITGWYIDDKFVSNKDYSITQTFSQGTHNISVETENLGPVGVDISVSENLELRFAVNLISGDTLSDIEYNPPYLYADESSFNLITMDTNTVTEAVQAKDVDGYRLIILNIIAYDWLINLMPAAENISESEFISYLNLLKTTEEPAPTWDTTRFYLQGVRRIDPDTFVVSSNGVTISGVYTSFDDMDYTVLDSVRKIHIVLKVETHDFDIFINHNLDRFFGIDEMNMTLDEMRIVSEVIRRYPEENFLEISSDF